MGTSKFYKISVYDETLDMYMVRKCSMRKGEALKMEKELTEKGILCRVSENVKDGKRKSFYCADFISKR